MGIEPSTHEYLIDVSVRSEPIRWDASDMRNRFPDDFIRHVTAEIRHWGLPVMTFAGIDKTTIQNDGVAVVQEMMRRANDWKRLDRRVRELEAVLLTVRANANKAREWSEERGQARFGDRFWKNVEFALDKLGLDRTDDK